MCETGRREQLVYAFQVRYDGSGRERWHAYDDTDWTGVEVLSDAPRATRAAPPPSNDRKRALRST